MVIEVFVELGQTVRPGDPLVVVEERDPTPQEESYELRERETGAIERAVFATAEGRVALSGGILARKARAGMELQPGESFLRIETGIETMEMIRVKRRAEIICLLAEDGQRVKPGDPLAVVEERDPTFAEYSRLWSKEVHASYELSLLRRRTPVEAFRLGRVDRRNERRRWRRQRRERGLTVKEALAQHSTGNGGESMENAPSRCSPHYGRYARSRTAMKRGPMSGNAPELAP